MASSCGHTRVAVDGIKREWDRETIGAIRYFWGELNECWTDARVFFKHQQHIREERVTFLGILYFMPPYLCIYTYVYLIPVSKSREADQTLSRFPLNFSPVHFRFVIETSRDTQRNSLHYLYYRQTCRPISNTNNPNTQETHHQSSGNIDELRIGICWKKIKLKIKIVIKLVFKYFRYSIATYTYVNVYTCIIITCRIFEEEEKKLYVNVYRKSEIFMKRKLSWNLRNNLLFNFHPLCYFFFFYTCLVLGREKNHRP